MQRPFDQLAKTLGKAALDPSGPTHGAEHAARRRSRNKRRSRKGLAPEPLVEPRLWIIAPTVSAPILRGLGPKNWRLAPQKPKLAPQERTRRYTGSAT